MIKVALIRGKFLNNFESQNYIFDKNKIELTAVSSLFPIHKSFPFPVIKFPSIADLGNYRLTRYLSNRLMGDNQMLFGLEKIADDFDIFHTADPHYYYSFQLARLRKKGLIKKLIVTSWETIPFNNESVKKKQGIKRFVLKQADIFICYTNKAKEVLIREGVDENKIEVVRLGVDLNRFKIANRKTQGQAKINILFAGRNVSEKGLEDLEKAIVGLVDISLTIASNIPYEKMPEIYQNADILVMPSRKTKTWEEQYGMVLVEAMASGLPVIAYDSGAISEVLSGSGILVGEGDIGSLRENIIKLTKDKELRLKIGKMERKRVEQEFDSKKTAQKIKTIYENNCGDNREK